MTTGWTPLDGSPGRVCPIRYRHGAAAIADAAAVATDVAWVVGGLYGNVEALAAIRDRIGRETIADARPIFNGDCHWFDVDPGDFATIEAGVADHAGSRGNVEAELATPSAAAGCGCGYPAFVDDATVERSNRILERLATTAAAFRPARARMAALPSVLRAVVAGVPVGVIHGDPDSLAGWALAHEHRASRGGPTGRDTVHAWARAADVAGFACTHTCLPWADAFGDVAVINNGSAGMPVFAGRPDEVLVTRIAPAAAPARDALYAVTTAGLRFEAIPVAIDGPAWRRRFTAAWPAGTPAHTSYAGRLRRGPAHRIADARPATGRAAAQAAL